MDSQQPNVPKHTFKKKVRIWLSTSVMAIVVFAWSALLNSVTLFFAFIDRVRPRRAASQLNKREPTGPQR